MLVMYLCVSVIDDGQVLCVSGIDFSPVFVY
jgi:hypothetical protein